MAKNDPIGSLERIRITLRGIGDALKGSQLVVPPYQRNFAWEERQVGELLGDIAQAIKDNEPEYFLGSIVLSEAGPSTLHVTDGQQRLATVTIVLATIRNYFLAENDETRAESIEQDFLLKRDRRSTEINPHLQLNVHDHEYYLKTVLERPTSGGKAKKQPPPPNKRLHQAIVAVKDFIDKIVETNPNDAPDVLLDWVDYLEKRGKVIWVTVPDDSNAFTIFETLNDRGLDLAISDLLKNFLFHLAGTKRLPEAQGYWSGMTGILEATAEEDILVTFLRHYWSSVHGLTRERDLYKHVKRKVTTAKQAIELAESLEGAAEQYAALANTNHELWRKYGPTAQGHIATLNLLRMSQMRPLLLAILDQFSETEAKKAFKFLVSCAVRLLIAGGRGGTVEATYSDAAKGIREGNVKSASDMRTAMHAIYPADANFQDAFAVATVSKDYLARYYLRALERSAAGEPSPEFIPNPNEEQINLEHVLPETPGKDWSHLKPDECKALYKRIGNMALMRAKDNTDAGNASLAAKQPFYAKSSFQLTQSIAKATQWDAKAIADRQLVLAKLAVKTWSHEF